MNLILFAHTQLGSGGLHSCFPLKKRHTNINPAEVWCYYHNFYSPDIVWVQNKQWWGGGLLCSLELPFLVLTLTTLHYFCKKHGDQRVSYEYLCRESATSRNVCTLTVRGSTLDVKICRQTSKSDVRIYCLPVVVQIASSFRLKTSFKTKSRSTQVLQAIPVIFRPSSLYE